MTDLTEQWRKGELPDDKDYYIKLKCGLILIDYYCQLYDNCHFPNGIGFDSIPENDIDEVLAEVPSYEEWKALKASYEMSNDANLKQATWMVDMEKENAQFKELLKECREVIKNVDTYYGNYDSTKGYLVINKIDEVLNE